MAAVCDICRKGPGFGKSVSPPPHQPPVGSGIQTVHAVTIGGNDSVCTSCIKGEGKIRLTP